MLRAIVIPPRDQPTADDVAQVARQLYSGGKARGRLYGGMSSCEVVEPAGLSREGWRVCLANAKALAAQWGGEEGRGPDRH